MQSSNVQSSSQDSPLENQNSFLETEFSELMNAHPQLTLQQSFHLEYCKLYLKSIHLKMQVDQIKSQIAALRVICPIGFKTKQISNQISYDGSNSERKKRFRRTANQIARHYVCKVQKCQKTYGSEGSLNQHMKLKHKDIMGTNYQ